MNNPAADLYEDISRIDEALEPFTGPQVEERPGLRWMQRTLRQRREHILHKIAETERSTLTVRARTADGSGAISAAMASSMLEVVQQALYDAAATVAWTDALGDDARRRAVTLVVGDATSDDEQWTAELHRPAGPFGAQPVTPDGDTLAVDAALAALLDTAATTPGAMAALVLEHGLTVDLAVAPATGTAAATSIDRHTAGAGE
jgi:hypothetical protein